MREVARRSCDGGRENGTTFLSPSQPVRLTAPSSEGALVGIIITPMCQSMIPPPVAVPDKIFGLTLSLDFIDRCHSIGMLATGKHGYFDSLRGAPRSGRCICRQAALPSLPRYRSIVGANCVRPQRNGFSRRFAWSK